MRIAVVFDWAFDWSPDQHAAQMAKEIRNRRNIEPWMHYQVANSLRKNGHDVLLFGIKDDPHAMSSVLAEWKPDLVFNATEAFLDNPHLDYLVPALLEAEGYRVIAVEDGEKALAQLRTVAIDLVVSDFMMPRLDGLALCAAMRADASLARIPVILMSASVTVAIPPGPPIVARMQKPLLFERLLARVREALDGRG